MDADDLGEENQVTTVPNSITLMSLALPASATVPDCPVQEVEEFEASACSASHMSAPSAIFESKHKLTCLFYSQSLSDITPFIQLQRS